MKWQFVLLKSMDNCQQLPELRENTAASDYGLSSLTSRKDNFIHKVIKGLKIDVQNGFLNRLVNNGNNYKILNIN